MPEQILIVEDDPSLQETLAYNLARKGYQVQTAGDGRGRLTDEVQTRINQPHRTLIVTSYVRIDK
jgi:DNA-binding response OmpR family regulator